MAVRGVYTTGQVSKILEVCRRTVIKWCEDCTLRSTKLPGSTHRRITKIDLRKFMRDNGLLEYFGRRLDDN